MNKQITIFIFISIISITACKTIKETDYRVDEQGFFQSLGPLKASVDIIKLREQLSNSKISLPGSFFGNLSIYKQNTSINIIMLEETYLDKPSAGSNLSANMILNRIPDIRAYDIINSFNFNINGNKVPQNDVPFAHLKLVHFEDKRNFPLVFFSICTL